MTGIAPLTGDAVVAVNNLGGFIRATVPRGTKGIVTGYDYSGTVHVQFVNGRTLALDPSDVVTADGRSDR